MASNEDYIIPSGAVDPESQPRGTIADFGKTLGAGALNVGSNLAAGARYLGDASGNENTSALSKDIQDIFSAGSDSVSSTINPETRKLAASAITSPEFLSHPLLAGALKVTGMLPSVAALAIPGGLMADVVGATMATAAAGGAIQAGQGLDDFYKKLDGLSDEDLQAQSPQYKTMRGMMDEGPARKLYNKQAQGWAPLLNTILGAAGGAVGPAGTAARGLVGGTENAVLGAGERGALASGGIGAAEGAGSNAAMAGGSDVLQQNVEMDGGMQKEFDKARALNAAGEGALMGGIMGGAVGLVAGGHGGAKDVPAAGEDAPVKTATDDAAAHTTDVAGPQVKEGTTGTPAKPAEIEANPQNAPTTTDRDQGKTDLKLAPKKPVVPQPIKVTSDIAAAVEANQGKPVAAQPTEAAAMTQRSPNSTLDKLDQEAPAPVTPPGNDATQAPQTPPAAPSDTGMNVPEAQQSIAEQIKQIGTGDRKAVMAPKGSVIPAAMLGGRTDLKTVNTPRGRFVFDPKLTNRSEITKLSNLGRENELLGLGGTPKSQAVADAAAGATPVAITERTGPAHSTPGLEVKAAAGTTDTLPEQHASLEAQKTPGNVVSVETPEQVIAARNATGGRILDTNTENIVNPKFEDNEARAAAADEQRQAHIAKAEAEEAGKGEPSKTNYRGERGRRRDAAIETAREVVEAHPANYDTEKNAQALPKPRKVVIERARAMVKDAEEKLGRPIQSQIKLSKDGTAPSDSPHVLTLRIAKDLVKHENSPQINKIVTDFIADEFMIKAGYKDEVIKRRLEEGDRYNKKTGGEYIEGVKDHAEQKGLDEEDFPLPDEKTDDEAPAHATGHVDTGVEDNVVQADEQAKHEYTDAELNQDDTERANTAKGVSIERSSAEGHSGMSVRQSRKMALARSGKGVPRPEIEGKVSLLPPKIKNDRIASEQKTAAEVSKIMHADALVAGDKGETNLNPTEGQKRANNYAKIHRRVEGMDVSIENPAGSIRSGDDANGKHWESRMPNGVDYGYVRRTTGADGDHVDIYDGRRGDKFFILDQLNHKTGEFDEHKILARFNSEEAALKAYHASFSDGAAAERIGNVHEVTPAELKDWLNNGDTTKSATSHFLGDGLERNPDKVNFDSPGPEQNKVRVAVDGTEFRSIQTVPASAMLKEMDFSKITGLHGVVARFVQERLMKLAHNVDVHLVDPENMGRVAGNENNLGLHVYDSVTQNKGEVFISTNAGEGYGVGSRAHALLHELIHAVTVREIKNIPGAEAQITKLMVAAYEHAVNTGMAGKIAAGKTNLRYGFTNAKEFMAEALSNKEFQQFLSTVPLDRATALHLGIGQKGRVATTWDAVRYFVKKAIEKVTGEIPQFDSVLDGVLRVGDQLTSSHKQNFLGPRERAALRAGPEAHVHSDALQMVDSVKEFVQKRIDQHESMGEAASPHLLKLRGMDNIARLADHFFGENNPVRKIHSTLERMRTTGEKLFEKSGPIITKLLQARAKDAAGFKEFQRLALDATYTNVHPDVGLDHADNAHLGKNAMNGVWRKAQHAELAKRYNALPSEFKAMWRDVNQHYSDIQNQMTRGIMKNMIEKLLGHKDDALAQRAHEGTLTDADRQTLGSNAETIENAHELSKIEGPYIPLMRRGDYVVKGDYKVTSPGNAKVISNKGGHVEFEFKTQKEAEDYAKTSKLEPILKKVWLDPETGEHLNANELDAVAHYRVTLRDRHVEFVQGKRAAVARHAELSADENLAMHKVVSRTREADGRQGAELSTALHRLVAKLEQSDAYKAATPTQRTAMRQAIDEASLASHGSTRISSRALPRRNVKGASDDMIQGMADYGQSSSRYLAKLEHGPALEAAMKEMAERLDQDHSKSGQQGRTAISNEVLSRVRGDNGFQQGGKFAPLAKRALALSFDDKLASPAYSVINGTQVAMITAPYLAARHGPGRAISAIFKAYNDIGGKSLLKEGAKGTALALKGGHKSVSLTDMIKRGLNPEDRAMIDHQIAEGTIADDAGMEIGKMTSSYEGAGGKVDKVIHYMDGVVREMPRAIEAINRSVTALATYRLERAKGTSREMATQRATDAVNETQFNYSSTNAPPIFNHPLLKLALQFKKYGQGVYQLIGSQIGDAIRNESPGDRARAIKTLVGIAATHTAMAGALGLPTEPFKYLVMAASPVTGVTWGDVENDIRKKAAELFGKTGGEVITRGLPRLLNLDMSRMGLDSVTSFGEPKSNKDNDVKSWLFDTVSGPVVSLGGDYIKGAAALANGDVSKAAELMVPVKAFSDSIRAYRQSTEGKKTATGKQSSAPYSPTEAGLRALGFGTGREAEEGSEKSAYYRQSGKAKDERNGLVNSWTTAKPADKAKAWTAIQQYNKTAPAESKITAKQLTDKSKHDAKDASNAHLGITPNKRDKRFLDEGIYNTR